MENDFLDDLPTQEVIFHTSLTESKRAPPISMMFNDVLTKSFISKRISFSISYDFKNGFYQMDVKPLIMCHYHVCNLKWM